MGQFRHAAPPAISKNDTLSKHASKHWRTLKDVEVGGDACLAELAVHADGVAQEEVARAREQQRGGKARQVPVHCVMEWW